MERKHLKYNPWLVPLSWLYGLGVALRNGLFDIGILRQREFNIPIISVGNITVGGTGKTPHVEYLIRLLHKDYHVAVLSRGYRRQSAGFVLATDSTPMPVIGDEPYQMKRTFPEVYVAVDKNRCHGITTLLSNPQTRDVDVVLLDDAYQHRYVRRGMNILLMDYHRLVINDRLLPAGRLREPQSAMHRADIVIITKCPEEIDTRECMALREVLRLRPYQKLFFTAITYMPLRPFSGGPEVPLDSITPATSVLLVVGIAVPQQLAADLAKHTTHLHTLAYGDHHYFTAADIQHISEIYASMSGPKMIITTEKDASRLCHLPETHPLLAAALYVLPIQVTFLHDQQAEFNDLVRTFVSDAINTHNKTNQ